MKPLISCENVAFAYDGNTVIRNVDFAIEEGAYLCIVGDNGSGKSTLVKGILGLKTPCQGRIVRAPHLLSHEMGYLPQQSNERRSFPATVTEIVLTGRLGRSRLTPFYSAKDRAAAQAALEQLGMGDAARCSFNELSGGQQQRVLLARAMCTAPDGLRLLILDEPTSGLDPKIRQEFYQIIRDLNSQRGIAIIMVTHDIMSATTYAGHLLYLGRQQEFFGTTHEFRHSTLGRKLMRDSCNGHCTVCGLETEWTS
jgi:zinc transport system ATP-binding protein